MGLSQSQFESCSPSCRHLSCPDSEVDGLSVANLDQGLPVIPECELFHEGGPDALQCHEDCQKNPGHTNFIPVKELTMEHLPQGHRTHKVMDQIKQLSNKTVKITVGYTSPNRPNTYPNSPTPYPYSTLKGSKRAIRCGTGVFILGPVQKEGPCPCHICKRSKNPERKYLLGVVSTAAHVVFDDMEARFSTFEMFYDCEGSNDDVKFLYGVGLFKDNFQSQRNNSRGKIGRSECCVSNGDSSNCGSSECCSGSSVDGNGGVDVEPTYWPGFHGDDEDATGVIKRCHQDRIWIMCATHDLQLAQIMDGNDKTLNKNKIALPRKYGVIVSHPHGLSKRVSFGPILHHRYPLSPHQPTDIPYTFEPGVRCRLRKSGRHLTSAVKAMKIAQSCQQFLKSDFPLRPGIEYKLKHRLFILVPPGAVFLSESVFQKGCANYWVTFHPGTKFALQEEEGEDLTYFVMPNAEFNLFETDFNFYTGLSYATYAIDTCPGCSGAEVLFTEIKDFHGQHSGALSDGTNRSALDFY